MPCGLRLPNLVVYLSRDLDPDQHRTPQGRTFETIFDSVDSHDLLNITTQILIIRPRIKHIPACRVAILDNR